MEHSTYAEQIVKKEKDGKTALLQGSIIALAVLCVLVLVLIPPLMPILPAMVLGIAVLVVFLVRRTNLEYEYTITDSRLEIDIIRGKSSRKRMLAAEVRNFEVLAPVESSEQLEHLRSNVQSVFRAVSQKGAQGCWYALYSSSETGKTLLVFQPNEQVMNVMLRYVPPRNVKKPSV